MILDVLRIPNVILKTRAHLIDPSTPGIQSFIDDMVETLYHHPRCVGLAANQVGKPWRVIVVDASRIDKEGSQHGRVILLNPWIVRREGQRLLREGCLSVPDYTGNVARALGVEVHGKDRAGNSVEIRADGFEAVVFQHELDHLDGKLFLDRVASLETDVFRRKKYY
ncbi:MAG TPA: peptide deformylase [Elusimicrobiota bacterium]|nr:peptide deformylase [Elusimicrobiota bacterium]